METFEETTETLAEGGSETPEDTTLKDVPEPSVLEVETQENGVRVSDDAAKGGVVAVVTNRVVETEISVETSIEVEKADGVVDIGKVKNGSHESQENGVGHGGVENDNGSASALGVNKNDKSGAENMVDGDGGYLLLIGGEIIEGPASVLKINKNEKNGVEKMAASSMSIGDSIEGPKPEIEVKEGNISDDGKFLDENGRDLDFAMVNVSCGEKDGEGDDAGNEGYEYSVGDFVWGKIKHHPWWPGQIYDPSDASEYALKYKQKDRYLVAYSGDGTFAWCSPSQLKPFEEYFVEFSEQSNSKSFINAVVAVLEDIGGLVELKMTCSCVLKDNHIKLTRPLAGNAGVKEGVFIPEGGSGKLTQFEPAQILAELKYISQVVSVGSMVELTVLKSKLSAFYRAKGGYQLPVYHLPQYIVGLEDSNQTRVSNNGYCNGQVDLPNQGPIKEDWLSSPGSTGFHNTSQYSLQKATSISDDKLYQRRKQKSIAEIINEEMDAEPKYQRKNMAKELTELSKTDGDTLKTESEMGYSPRERKRSKYLSPPFTNLERRQRNSSSKRESEAGFLSVTSSARIGERMSKAAGELFASPPILKCSAETHKKKLPTEPGVGISGSPIPPAPKPAPLKMVVDPIVTTAPANVVLSKFRCAALGHLHLRDPKSLDMIRVFFSTFRGSIFRNGPYYKLYNKRRPGRKRKSVDPKSGSLADEFNLTDPNSPESKSMKKRIKKNEAKSDTPKHIQGEAVDQSKLKIHEKAAKENGSSAALFLTFGPGVSLPSKDDLIETYSKFGPVDKAETDVLFNSSCAQVVFVRSSDAEQAFKHSMSSNKDANITYRLRYLNSGSKIRELDDSPHPKASSLPKDGGDGSESPSLESIKQKLEIMTSMVDKSDGNMSQEMKINLEGELKGLLEKVSTM